MNGGPDDSRDRPALFATLQQGVVPTHCVPVALGHGLGKLEHKVAALLYSWHWEVGLEHLGSFLDSIISMTTDMGTEVGAANTIYVLNKLKYLYFYIS